EIIPKGTGLVLLLRTLAEGMMTGDRLKNTLVADQVWVMTEEMKSIIQDQMNSKELTAEQPEIKILQSGIDPEIFNINSNIKRKKGKIVYVGALTKIKGVDILVESFKEVRKKFPQAELHLIGDPSIYGRINTFDPS